MTHASVFSGIGGPEVGAAMLGWENLFHCEINDFCREVLEYHFPNSKSYGDIQTTDFSEWRGRVDVLTGGFPCQPFSFAGRRKGAEDDRYLWPAMLSCIEEVQPRWFVGENVHGITTMVFPGDEIKVASNADIFDPRDILRREERYVLNEICENLESIGYDVQPIVIPACAVGAPHRRSRIFIVASCHAQDSVYVGCEGKSEKLGCSELARNTRAASGDGKTQRTVADTDIERLEESRCHGRRTDAAQEGAGANGRIERPNAGTCGNNVSHSQHKRLCGMHDTRSGEGVNRHGVLRIPAGHDFAGMQDRWRRFPTQSPVHRGNDGIPFDVDSLSIPFQTWRRETLKSYGNAIVPQVMYEIFRAIEAVENTKDNTDFVV